MTFYAVKWGLCLLAEEGWQGLHYGSPGFLVAMTMALRIYGPEKIAMPIVLGTRAALGNILCLVGGADDVGVRTSITGSDKNGESHCEGRGSCLGERAGGRVWSGRLGRDSRGLDLREDVWLRPRGHESFWKGFKRGAFNGSFIEMAF